VELRKSEMNLEKALNESDSERKHLKEQIGNLQRLLAKSEDEKDLRYNIVWILMIFLLLC